MVKEKALEPRIGINQQLQERTEESAELEEEGTVQQEEERLLALRFKTYSPERKI